MVVDLDSGDAPQQIVRVRSLGTAELVGVDAEGPRRGVGRELPVERDRHGSEYATESAAAVSAGACALLVAAAAASATTTTRMPRGARDGRRRLAKRATAMESRKDIVSVPVRGGRARDALAGILAACRRARPGLGSAGVPANTDAHPGAAAVTA